MILGPYYSRLLCSFLCWYHVLLFFSHPCRLTFFVNYAKGAIESLWSIDQYFEFVLILMFNTGLSFQMPFHAIDVGKISHFRIFLVFVKVQKTCCYMTPLSSALHEGSYTIY
ncbi:Sec-independent protein translocase protein TATC chloroplastic [Bienertia sinuspersici]